MHAGQVNGSGDRVTGVRSAWDRGEGASSLRPLVEEAAEQPGMRAAVASLCASRQAWEGLWEARIEHFEKVRATGLRVRPHYALSADGSIVSHVHIALGPLRGWLSASGAMEPSSDGTRSVSLTFDDFWVGADAPSPRAAPPEDGDKVSVVDRATRSLGRALFFEGLAGFPVDYVDGLANGASNDQPIDSSVSAGLVAFRFPPLNSCIVAARRPDGAQPQRVDR